MVNRSAGWLIVAGVVLIFAFGTTWVLAKASATKVILFQSVTGSRSGGSSGPSMSLDYKLVDSDEWTEIAPELNDFQLEIVEKLNRADRQHLHLQDRLIIPLQWPESELAYSPLPYIYPWARIYKKALVVSLSHQVFGAYEEGCLVYWGPVNSGRLQHPTPSGIFHLNWKSKGRSSTLNRDWFLTWYFNFHNRRGLSFHQYALPGYPASHACLRLLERDARWLYDWGEMWELEPDGVTVARQGTRVLIFGQFDWDAPRPWLGLEPEARKVVPPWLPEQSLNSP